MASLPAYMLSAGTLCAQAPADADITAAIEAARKATRKQAPALNLAAGNLLKEAGRYAEAIPFLVKGGNAGNLGAAEASFYLYDFEAARDYIDTYMAKRTEAEAARDANYTYGIGTDPVDWAEYLSGRIDIGRSMLDRVEKVQIIDSINVPAEEFFEFVRIAGSAGSLQSEEATSAIVTVDDLDRLGIVDIASPAYLTEKGDEMIWVGYNADGGSAVYESIRLADDSWDSPRKLFDYPAIFKSANGSVVSCPFLMSDGATLYFAADGEESLGGLDIFISRYDEDGFLQPSNIGMPYNSPYNDYLYAVDELNGVGWWATDRNGIPDMVTVYTFLPQELRNNYSADTPRLTDYAKVTSIADTWVAGTDYADVKKRIDKSAESRKGGAVREFDFALPDGRILHRLSDFRSAMARNLMKNYLKEREYADKAAETLEEMRRRYGAGDTSLATEILGAEKSLERTRASLLDLSNQVVSAEM